MKLGVSSYSFQKHIKQTGATYRDICKLAKDIGFDGIEFIDLDLNVQPAQDVLALADDIKAYCAEIGLTIIAYTVGADFIGGGAEEVNKVKAKVDIAERLGAKVMRHDAAWKLEEGMTWRQAVDKIAAPIREVAEYAQGKGIRTCTENHGYVLQDAHRVETLIQTVNHPNYGWLVDMGNFLCADEPAVHALPIAAPYAFHAHAKDFLYKPSWEPNPGDGWFASRGGAHLRGTVVGHGVVPLAYCIEVLRNSGYEGWLSYEFEGMEENIPAIKAGYQVLRTLLEK